MISWVDNFHELKRSVILTFTFNISKLKEIIPNAIFLSNYFALICPNRPNLKSRIPYMSSVAPTIRCFACLFISHLPRFEAYLTLFLIFLDLSEVTMEKKWISPKRNRNNFSTMFAVSIQILAFTMANAGQGVMILKRENTCLLLHPT